MTIQSNDFDASQLCSRKLWQLVNEQRETDISDTQLAAAIEELTSRRHYLEELTREGKLQSNH
ncbi:MAG: hypothetical protein ABJN62_08300 [Halioglobus sp.]